MEVLQYQNKHKNGVISTDHLIILYSSTLLDWDDEKEKVTKKSGTRRSRGLVASEEE